VTGISYAEIDRIVSGQPYTCLRDFWERARVSRPVAERLVLTGGFDSLYARAPERPTRRDLLARVGVLARQDSPARPAPTLDLFGDAEAADGMAGLVPAGQLRELEPDERVAAELEILGFDISRHVLDFYADLLAGLGVVRSTELDDHENGEMILVAGVKVATQTPAVRSGQRIIFASLDDAAGLADLAFFESVQDRCAARLFGSWLLLVRGRVRRAGAGPMAVTVNATVCWDIPALEEIRLASGLAAVRGAMATGDVGPGMPSATTSSATTSPAAGAGPETSADWPGVSEDWPGMPFGADDSPSGEPAGGQPGAARRVVFANGFTLSPYAETGGPGGSPKKPPRAFWHASPGSTKPPD
jgi:error-prone DNA polymerase